MTNFGHIQRVTASVGMREFTFRSKLEYHYAVYLELLKSNGHIQQWEYEPEDMSIEFQHGPRNNTRKYLPDFAVLANDDEWEVHETKGYFPPIDATKLRKYADMHDNRIILIFGGKVYGAQKRRVERLSKHIHRVILGADKELFKPISHLFDY
jgi:hypothetical protein